MLDLGTWLSDLLVKRKRLSKLLAFSKAHLDGIEGVMIGYYPVGSHTGGPNIFSDAKEEGELESSSKPKKFYGIDVCATNIYGKPKMLRRSISV